MASYFFDTSALAKRYHQEVGTPEVEQIFQAVGAEIMISRLAVVELRSVFAMKVRTQVILAADFQRLVRLFRADVANRVVKVVRITAEHFKEAERLLEKHAVTKSFRTLDAIQLAVAVKLNQMGRADHFVCADQRLCLIAQDEGLSVINPEIP